MRLLSRWAARCRGAGVRALAGCVFAGAVAMFVPVGPADAAAGQPTDDGAVVGAPIVIDDLLRLRTIRGVDVSADGRRVVFVVQSSVLDAPAPGDATPASATVRVQRHLYLADLAVDGDARVRQLTVGDRSDRAPAISPDGSSVAFLRAGPTSATWDGMGPCAPDAPCPETATQVWVMPLDGGEARQVTWFRRGCGAPAWAPDGRTVLVTVRTPVSEIDGTPPWNDARPGADAWRGIEPGAAADAAAGDRPPMSAGPIGSRDDLRRWLHDRTAAADPRVYDRIDFQGERDLAGPLTLGRAVLVNVADGVRRERDRDTVRVVTRDFIDCGSPVLSADGTAIFFTAAADPTLHPNDVRVNAIYRSAIDGSGVRAIVRDPAWSFGSPRVAADGRVGCTARRTDEPTNRGARLAAVSPDRITAAIEPGGDAADQTQLTWLTSDDTFDHLVRSYRWRGSGESAVFTATVRGGVPLCAAGAGLLAPAPLVQARGGLPIGVGAFDTGGTTIAWVEHGVRAPSTLWVRTPTGDQAIFDANPWVADRAISIPASARITRPDGLDVEYWVMRPTRPVPGGGAPVVLQIHGGPAAMWGPGESTMWHEFQVLCGWGYAVVYANPRGSGGYGDAFRSANDRDWGQGPAGDVLASLDDALAQHEWMDGDRLFVTGGSYGGYLTAWIVGNDQRFRAAVAQRGVYHLTTFYGEGNAWRLLEYEMGGKPWEARMETLLRRESPFSYVTRMRTPLLIMHGDEDLRTGVSQSEMLYRALRDLGRPVEYVRYPATGHDLSRTGQPERRMDRLARIVEFFERFAENDVAAPRADRPSGLGG